MDMPPTLFAAALAVKQSDPLASSDNDGPPVPPPVFDPVAHQSNSRDHTRPALRSWPNRLAAIRWRLLLPMQSRGDGPRAHSLSALLPRIDAKLMPSGRSNGREKK